MSREQSDGHGDKGLSRQRRCNEDLIKLKLLKEIRVDRNFLLVVKHQNLSELTGQAGVGKEMTVQEQENL